MKIQNLLWTSFSGCSVWKPEPIFAQLYVLLARSAFRLSLVNSWNVLSSTYRLYQPPALNYFLFLVTSIIDIENWKSVVYDFAIWPSCFKTTPVCWSCCMCASWVIKSTWWHALTVFTGHKNLHNNGFICLHYCVSKWITCWNFSFSGRRLWKNPSSSAPCARRHG